MKLWLPMLALSLLVLACDDGAVKVGQSDTAQSDTAQNAQNTSQSDTLTDTAPSDVSDTTVAPDGQNELPADVAVDTTNDAVTPELVINDPCYGFSNDVDLPLAIDGAFDATSVFWRRPYDDPEVCPATAFTPANSALVPVVGFAFCNNDAVSHTYDFEMLAAPGPNGEPELDDPFLFLYAGQGLPADVLQCLAVNDDLPDAIDAKDSIIEGVVVAPGQTITMLGTTYTYDPTDRA